MRVRALLQVLVGLAPWPAEQAKTRNDARSSDDGPERAAGHRRSVDQVKPLPEPYRASHEEQPSDHASGEGHGKPALSGNIPAHWHTRIACTLSRGRSAGKQGVRSRKSEGW